MQRIVKCWQMREFGLAGLRWPACTSRHGEQVVAEALAPLLDPSLDGPQPGLVAETLPAVRAAIVAYAVEVEALAAPEQFRADQARHVSGLREISANMEAAIAADAARDQEQVDALERNEASLVRNLPADLSPEYAALAFSPEQGVEAFIGLSPEESDYFDDVAAAQEEFSSRNSQFSAVIGQVYTSTEALLNALYETGAGEAVAAVQDVAVTIEPPPRFEADHARWLVLLEEQVRIDRLIGESARDGDIVKFEVNNKLLGLAANDASIDFSSEFALVIGVPPAPDLGPDSAIAATSYGQELAEALATFTLPPLYTIGFFPTTPDDAVLETIPQIAPELIARIERGRASVAALSPPEQYAADHATILQYFDDLLANQDATLAAAASGDIDAVRTGIDKAVTRDLYCAAATGLSDDVLPVATYFGGPGEPNPNCTS